MNNKPEQTKPACRTGRCGSTILEFVLAGSFIFVPLLAGTATVGMSLLRSIQVTALNRDAGHMFAQGVDFSQAANRNLLVKIAGDLNLAATGGKGVVILSEIDGTGANQAVCSKRLVIGNASLRVSNFVNPGSTLIDSGGNVTNLSDPSASASKFTPSVMAMSKGTVAYVAETYFSTSDHDWSGFLTNTGIYVWAVF